MFIKIKAYLASVLAPSVTKNLRQVCGTIKAILPRQNRSFLAVAIAV